MSGLDFLLENRPGDTALGAAVATALGVPENDVQVVSSVEEIRDGVPVAVELTPTKGDFRTQLSIYTERPIGTAEVARLTAQLGTRALIPDDSPNPYTMLLVETGRPPRTVALEVESLDDRDEYRLAPSL